MRCNFSPTALTSSVTMVCRVALSLLLVTHCIDLYYGLLVPQAIVLPALGILKPIFGVALCYVACFVNGHAAIRWIVSTPRHAWPEEIVAGHSTHTAYW